MVNMKRFHHIEFWCGDATNTSLRFSWGLGMRMVAKSDLSTGNLVHASYVLRSGDLDFLFTAPYAPSSSIATAGLPTFKYQEHASFMATHGLGVRAVAIEVDDVMAAFTSSMAAGARPCSPPILLEDGHTQLAEVQFFGDVVLRLISHGINDGGLKEEFDGNYFLPKFSPVHNFDHLLGEGVGLKRLDHVGGVVPELAPVIDYVMRITGFHEFQKFETEEFGRVTESGIHSTFLADSSESAFLNLSEAVYDTLMKSPMETFLERNQGPGVQHLALMTDDIFKTIREMKKRAMFDYMPPPSKEYYDNLKESVKDVLTKEQIQDCEELGLKVDMDYEGVLIQTFTTPIGDRPTIFIEIMQRIGCMLEGEDGKVYQRGGCGGFGKGNVFELLKSLEQYDKTLVNPA
ncbi:4-hydroxyphenylpyruvate dioxygenase [Bienertia sinuspersici]